MKNRKSGIELIAIERQEQIKKHGFSLLMDKEYKNGELLKAAQFCLTPKTDNSDWPQWWKTTFKYKILEDTRIEQLVKAGAFFMAENDRSGNNNCDSDIEKVAAEIDRLQTKNKNDKTN